jgi:hypothetical protein
MRALRVQSLTYTPCGDDHDTLAYKCNTLALDGCLVGQPRPFADQAEDSWACEYTRGGEQQSVATAQAGENGLTCRVQTLSRSTPPLSMPIPVNIVTGSLGAGKTTALHALLRSRPEGASAA